MARLYDEYKNSIAPALMNKFGYKTVMQIPKLDKVVINVGCGEAKDNSKVIDAIMNDLAIITGQKAVPCKAKKSVANFKLREGMPIGVKAPVFGDSVKITATFENTVDKGYDSDYLCYTMMVSECEVVAHGVGPNGGRIMFITASSLNVRASSDTSSSANILGTLSLGDAVEVFDQDEKGWWRIEFNGQTAYISNKYVSETRP